MSSLLTLLLPAVATAQPPHAPAVRVMPLGDSITLGGGAGPPGYRGPLGAFLLNSTITAFPGGEHAQCTHGAPHRPHVWHSLDGQLVHSHSVHMVRHIDHTCGTRSTASWCTVTVHMVHHIDHTCGTHSTASWCTVTVHMVRHIDHTCGTHSTASWPCGWSLRCFRPYHSLEVAAECKRVRQCLQ
jgi:hypothetical protein